MASDNRQENSKKQQRSAIFEEVLDLELHHLTGRPARRRYSEEKPPKDDQDPDSSYVRCVISDAHRQKLCGLAFSGGGIRSATFNLGVLQTLAKLDLLKEFDYLSTVSGGGYIGSWLAAWMQREQPADDRSADRPQEDRAEAGQDQAVPDQADTGQAEPDQAVAKQEKAGIDIVSGELASSAINGETENSPGNMQLDPAPIWHLREYSNYLTPRRGLWSTDAWAFFAAYFRNLLLTLSVLLGGVVTCVLFIQFIASGLYQLVGMDLESGQFFSPLYYFFIISILMASFFLGIELSPARARTATSAALAYVAVILALVSAVFGSIWLWSLARDVEKLGFLEIFIAVAVFMLGTVVSGLLGRWLGNRVCSNGAADEADDGSQNYPGLIFGSIVAVLVLIAMWAGVRSWMSDDAFLMRYWFPVIWGVPILVFTYSVATAVYVGLVGSIQQELEREWLARFFGALTKLTVLFTLLMILVVYSFDFVESLPCYFDYEFYRDSIKPGLVSLWAILSGLGAFLARNQSSGDNTYLQLTQKLFIAIAPPVFILGLLVITTWGTGIVVFYFIDAFIPESSQAPGWLESLSFYQSISGISDVRENISLLTTDGYWLLALVLCVFIFILTWLWSRLVGVNDFSLHALYGNRLVRAYLGASNRGRRAHPFTGFAQQDNSVSMASMVGSTGRRRGPYLIINAAINLVLSRRLAWQKRKAASFVFTPLFSGFEFCEAVEADDPGNKVNTSRTGGYVFSSEYGGGHGRGVSLGKAMTISGAAASPNMGYFSSPALAFLMTTFNLRLGWWLPNTAKRDLGLLEKNGPSTGLLYLIIEALGLTSTDRDYVYLSDGGHFENLGIYELVRRRCQFIVACDAEADPSMSFSGLGNAIEKCRADLGVPIQLDVSQIMHGSGQGHSDWHCAVGCIRYSEADAGQHDGTLLYIKASLTGDEPLDVATYANSHSSFPHETTADQWFDESQFEAYRALGEHAAFKVLTNAVSIAGHRRSGGEKFLERIFLELRKQWYPDTTETDAGPEDVDTRLENLLEIFRNDSRLEFLDSQLYPNLQRVADHIDNSKLSSFIHHKDKDIQKSPKNSQELRAGFYFCKQLIQLMQQVFNQRRLDTEYYAPSNRGWMNLFRRWALSRMFRFTWAMTAGTYSARFQSFCEYHLALDSGDPFYGKSTSLVATVKGDTENPDVSIALPGEHAEQHRGDSQWERQVHSSGLHLFECWLIKEFIRAYVYCKNIRTVHPEKDYETMEFRVLPLKLEVDNVLDAEKDHELSLNAGFAIIGPCQRSPRLKDALLFFRIRSSMRNMDLARKAFIKISSIADAPEKIVLDHDLPDVEPERFENSLHRRAYREVHELDRENMVRCRWFSQLLDNKHDRPEEGGC